ncbi:MAG: 2-nitropropane dioxygenase, partial [Actinobacteria bacterium]
MSWPDTRLLDLFGVDLPILLAPMANFAGLDMALAVAEAGALAALPCATLNAEQIKEGVAKFRAQSSKPLNLNFFCHTTPEQNV